METQQRAHAASRSSSLLRLPAELRLAIFAHLLDDGGDHWVAIRALPKLQQRTQHSADWLVRDSTPKPAGLRRLPRITYALGRKNAQFHTAIMSTNRQIYDETSNLIYAQHSFDFGKDIEAVIPFFQDRTPHSRSLISSISLQKISPAFELIQDRHEWADTCQFLATYGSIRTLRLVIEGAHLDVPWLGPAEFSAKDFEILLRTKHTSLDWIRELARIRGAEKVEVVPYYLDRTAFMDTTAVIVFNTYSASIERGLAEFIRGQLGIS